MLRPLRPGLLTLTLTASLAGVAGLAPVPAAHAAEAIGTVVGNTAAWGDRDPANDQDGDSVYGYADNYYGQQDVPADLAGKRITAVAASDTNSVALDSDGKVHVWGYAGVPANGWGTAPPAALASQTVTAIDAFFYGMIALTANHTVHTWGSAHAVPAALSDKNVTKVAMGGAALALTDEAGGKVYAWGNNLWGEAVVPPAAQSGVIAIAGDRVSSLALKADGSIVMWGAPFGTVPAPDPGRHFVDISAGGDNKYAAIDDAGKVYTWGYFPPAPPAELTDEHVVAIDVGATMTSAVTDTGELFLWGDDGYRYIHRAGCPDTVDPSCTAADSDNRAFLPANVAGRPVLDVAVGNSHLVAALQTPVTNLAPPTISGTARVGQTLTATPGGWLPADAAIGYQWRRNGAPIADATASTYTLTDSDDGATITVAVSGTRSGYLPSTAAVSDALIGAPRTPPVSVAAMTATAPTITVKTRHKVVRKLVVATGQASVPGAQVTVQWLRNGKAITGATATTYRVTRKDRGAKVRARVTWTAVGHTGTQALTRAVRVPR